MTDVDSPHRILQQVLGDSYGIDLARLEPARRGMMSDAFEAVASDGQRWFVKIPLDRPCYQVDSRGREAALRSTLEVRSLIMSANVIAPVLTVEGKVSATAGGHTVTLFPFVEGAPLGRRATWTNDQFATIATAMAELHACTSLVNNLPIEDSLGLWWGASLEDAWRAFQESPSAGEARSVVLQTVSSHLGEIRRAEAECLRLRELINGGRQDWVLCHCDLNGGNIHADAEGRLSIVDWDEMLLAPMERDLRHLVDMPRLDLALSAYHAVRPEARPNADALAFFLYRGYLADIAYWLCDLASSPDDTVDPSLNLEDFVGEVEFVAGPGLPERVAVLRHWLA